MIVRTFGSVFIVAWICNCAASSISMLVAGDAFAVHVPLKVWLVFRTRMIPFVAVGVATFRIRIPRRPGRIAFGSVVVVGLEMLVLLNCGMLFIVTPVVPDAVGRLVHWIPRTSVAVYITIRYTLFVVLDVSESRKT